MANAPGMAFSLTLHTDVANRSRMHRNCHQLNLTVHFAGLKVWKPTSPGQRGRITVDRSLLWKGPPFKPLTHGITGSGGRSATGRISVWHQGGGHKRLYRLVDFVRPTEQESRVVRLEYDPNRSARIALVQHEGSAWEGACAHG